MRFFLFLLLTPLAFSQYIKVLGDTTDLKTYDGSGIVLLEQYGGVTWDVTGGGLFHRVDSTFAEGTHAFDYPYEGFQWARIQWIGSELSAFNDLYANTFSLEEDVSIGTGAFTTTATSDTVIISGAEATDRYWIQPISETVDAQDNIFQVNAKDDTLVVVRPASGASGLQYYYLRIKEH